MSGDAIALALGTALAVGALAYVLYPLFFAPDEARPDTVVSHATEDSAIVALREIEFDRATGKLSDADYQALRASYAPRALQELRAGDGVAPPDGAAPPDAPAMDIEARVRAYRAARRECDRCGLRPEPDAVYCSTCGGYLGGVCPTCAAPVSETSATFCSACGTPLGGVPAPRQPA